MTDQTSSRSEASSSPFASVSEGRAETGPIFRQARSEKTYFSLLESTLKVIVDEGYQHTTTPQIARTSGVSRGALNHHFSTKKDLILAAADHLLAQTAAQIEVEAANAAADDAALDTFVDNMWKLFSGPFFYVSLELIVASRTDADLRARMVPIVKRFHHALDRTWTRHFHGRNPGKKEDMMLNMTLCLLRGMGVQTVLKDDPGYYKEMLSLWKRTLAREL